MGFKTFIFNSLKIQLTISNNKQNNGNTESKLDLWAMNRKKRSGKWNRSLKNGMKGYFHQNQEQMIYPRK